MTNAIFDTKIVAHLIPISTPDVSVDTKITVTEEDIRQTSFINALIPATSTHVFPCAHNTHIAFCIRK